MFLLVHSILVEVRSFISRVVSVMLSYSVRYVASCLPLFFSDVSFFSVSLSDHITCICRMEVLVDVVG